MTTEAKVTERDDGKVWTDCWQCGGEGYIDGECTCWEDCCCCLEPEPPMCSHCHGQGGYFVEPQYAEDNP